jgi:pimeloyl-ACP methyl ester carboxylesterase
LEVIDVTEPEAPKLLKEIPLPNLGIPQTLKRRSDGLLALATSDDVVLLDPTKLLLDTLSNGQLPAIVGTIKGAGSGANSFAADPSGVNAVNLGNKNEVIFTAPAFRFLIFNRVPMTSSNLANLDTETKLGLLADATDTTLLTRTKFFTNAPAPNPPGLNAPIPTTHYYIRMDALGSLGATVPLVLESLNGAGKALPGSGFLGLPARLASSQTLSAVNDTNGMTELPKSLNAFRMATDPGSPLYNVYLAGPVTLSGSAPSSAQALQIEGQLARAVVQAGRFLWVGLDPSASLGPYPSGARSSIANARVVPGASGFVLVDNPQLPLILVPGVAGSHLNRADDDTERWPGLSFVGKSDLSLNPENVAIVASDIMRIVPEPYLGLRFTPANCLDAPIYEPLLEFLSQKAGFREYDFLKLNTNGLLSHLPLPCAAGTPITAQKSLLMATNRTVKGADYDQISLDPNLFVFAYDWRRSNVTAAVQLKEYVEVVKRFHPEADQVNILAHSMGGLVARRYILDNPGTVNKLITLGSPWLGAPKAINVMETGDFLDFAQHLVIIFKSTLKQLAEFFPGPQELLPSPAYFNLVGQAGSPIVDRAGDLPGTIPGIGGGPLSFPNFKQVMDSVYHTNPVVTPVAVSEAFHTYSVPGVGQQDDWQNDNTGVEYFHIIGVQSEPNTVGRVVSRLRIRPTDQDPVNVFHFTHEFGIEYTMGDGTVPLFSSLRRNGSADLNVPGAHIYQITSPGPDQDKLSDHNGMLANTNLLALVGQILDGDIPTNAVAPGPSGVVTYVVHVVNAASNEVTVVSFGNSSLISHDMDIGTDVGDGTEVERKLDIPGLKIQEPATNIVDAVLEGQFDLTAHYNGHPISLRVEEQLDGVTQAAYIWSSLDSSDFPSGPQTNFDALVQVHSPPLVTAKAGGNAVLLPPDAVLTGAAARDETQPTLSFYYTNESRAIAFNLSQAGAPANLPAVYVTGVTNENETTPLIRFINLAPANALVVPVDQLLPLATGNRVYAYVANENGTVSAGLAVDLLTLDLTLIPSGLPLEDWPAENGHPRSPKILLNTQDAVSITLRAQPGLGNLAYRVLVASASDPTGIQVKLQEVSSGVYQNTNTQDALQFVPLDPNAQTVRGVEIKDEELATFRVFNAAGSNILQSTVMVDIGELAVASLTFADRTDDARPQFDFQDTFLTSSTGLHWVNAGFRDNFPDDVGLQGIGPGNPMADFIINFADPALPNAGEADLLYVHTHGSKTGSLLDHTTKAPILFPEVHLANAWKHDAEWVVLDACSTLNNGFNTDLTPFTNGVAGRTNWTTAIRGSSRPIHGILAFSFPKSARIRPQYQSFLNLAQSGMPLTAAWTNAMEPARLPWAYLFYESALGDTFRVISQQPLPTDKLIYNEYTGVLGDNCEDGETSQGGRASSRALNPAQIAGEVWAREDDRPPDLISVGQGVFLSGAVAAKQAPSSSVPLFIGVRRRPSLQTRSGERSAPQLDPDRQVLVPTKLSKLPRAPGDRAAASDAARGFLWNELGLAADSISLLGVGEIRSQTIYSNSATPLLHEAFVAHYRQRLWGIPVEDTDLAAEIAGDAVRRVSAQGLVEETVDRTPTGPLLGVAEAANAARNHLERIARRTGKAVVTEATLAWIAKPGSRDSSPGSGRLLPAWRMSVCTTGDGDPDQVVYVNAITGEPL